jgi:hypothetical protein
MWTIAGGIILAVAVLAVVALAWRGIMAVLGVLAAACVALGAGAVLWRLGVDWTAVGLLAGLVGAFAMIGRLIERQHERKRPSGSPGRWAKGGSKPHI